MAPYALGPSCGAGAMVHLYELPINGSAKLWPSGRGKPHRDHPAYGQIDHAHTEYQRGQCALQEAAQAAPAAHRLPGVQECRLQEVQPEARVLSRPAPRPAHPPKYVKNATKAKARLAKPDLVLELGPARLPTEALGVALVEDEVPEEGQKPDEADCGGRGYRQGACGVRQTREPHPQPQDARDQLQDVQHPRDHFVSPPSL